VTQKPCEALRTVLCGRKTLEELDVTFTVDIHHHLIPDFYRAATEHDGQSVEFAPGSRTFWHRDCGALMRRPPPTPTCTTPSSDSTATRSPPPL
jgi:hypothetical protein